MNVVMNVVLEDKEFPFSFLLPVYKRHGNKNGEGVQLFTHQVSDPRELKNVLEIWQVNSWLPTI